MLDIGFHVTSDFCCWRSCSRLHISAQDHRRRGVISLQGDGSRENALGKGETKEDRLGSHDLACHLETEAAKTDALYMSKAWTVAKG